MAIKKVHSAAKRTKETKKEVPAVANLEEKRRHFQESVKKGGATSHAAAKTPAKHHTHVKRSIIIAVAAGLLIAGTACMAYLYFWAQAPQKVVIDSLLSAISAPAARYDGTVTVGGAKPVPLNTVVSEGKMQISSTIDTAFSGDLSKMTISMMATQSDMYFKIDKASRFIEVTTNVPGSTAQAIAPEVKKQIDNRWTVPPKADYQALAPVMRLLACGDGVLKKISDQRQVRSEITNVYLQHPFLQITETTPFTAAVGEYRLAIDNAQFASFIKAVSQTPALAGSDECKKQLHSLDLTRMNDADMTVTIDKASRTLKTIRLVAGGTTKVTVDLKPSFNDVQPLQVPSDGVKFDDIDSPIYKQFVQATLQQLGQALSAR